VVDGIMKGHEGAIRVTSAPGAGSTFTLYFPAADSTSPQATAINEVGPRGQGQCILYLDDDQALVTLTVKTLERNGYRSCGFTQAIQAIEAVRNHPRKFDLVVTDYTMPGFSGIQVAKQLLHLRPGLPVLLTSGYVTDDLRKRAEDVGISQVLHKPHSANELCAAIQRALANMRT